MARGAERAVWALVGLRCSGKTSVGLELARLSGRPCLDLDLELAREHGAVDAGELLRARGLEDFRRLEAGTLARVLEEPGPRILATGGGVVELAESRALLASRAWCIWLREEVGELQRRLALDPTCRPALEGADPVVELPGLATRRAPLYAQVAHLVLDGSGRSPERLAEEVLAQARPGREKG